MEMIHNHFETLRSTNDWAKEHISEFGRDELTLITTDSQTNGRGQYARQWISPPHLNFLGSFCFFISEEGRDPLSLTHVLALSTCEVLESYGLLPRIKWPNDILVGKRKIAGILCETIHLPPHFGVILGMGLNVNMPAALLEKVGQPATSLLVESGHEEEVNRITEKLQISFLSALSLFIEQGFEPFLPKFRAHILPK